jgi:hypothetical protein
MGIAGGERASSELMSDEEAMIGEGEEYWNWELLRRERRKGLEIRFGM